MIHNAPLRCSAPACDKPVCTAVKALVSRGTYSVALYACRSHRSAVVATQRKAAILDRDGVGIVETIPASELCPLCGRESRFPGGYMHCSSCGLLTGYRQHAHTHRTTPAQEAAGLAPNEWQTSAMMFPAYFAQAHVGWDCGKCDFHEPLNP